MKRFICFLILFSCCGACWADWNTFETKQQAYDRRSNENYNTYKNNNYQQPLGGYNRPMNDNGGRQYGSNGSYGMNSYNSNNRQNANTNNSWGF